MSYEYPEITHYELKHYLKDALKMPIEALAMVSPEHLEEYSDEFDLFKTEQGTDVQSANELAKLVRKGVEILFGGRYTKQAKYFDRALSGGEVVTDVHMRKYPQPNEVRSKVTQAKENVDLDSLMGGSSEGVSEETLSDIDNAVSFLISEGYAYGSDFNASNAYSIAKGVIGERVFTNPNDFISSIKEEEECGHCVDEDEGWRIHLNNGQGYGCDSLLSCGCGENNYDFEISFADSNPKVLVSKHES